MKFFEELKKRNVYKAGVAYVVTGWLLLQIADVVGPGFGWPESATATLTKILLVGLPIALVLAWLYELTPKGFKRTGTFQEETTENKKAGRRLNYFIIGVLSVAVCFLLVDKVFFSGVSETDTPQQASMLNLPEFTSSIAVLAFDDMSPNQDQGYFSDGISEEILNYLSKYKDLKVISSSFAYKGKDVSLEIIGEELNVAYVLEGSVRKAGNTFRITVQLIDANDGSHVWSDTFDRKIEDVLFVQDEIAKIVAKRLKLTFSNEDVRLRKVDPEAFDLYLRACELDDKPGDLERSVVEQKIDSLLQRALAIDSTYAPLHAEYAGTLFRQTIYEKMIDREDGLKRAMHSARKAYRIDPDNEHALVWCSNISWHLRDIENYQKYLDELRRLEGVNELTLVYYHWCARRTNQVDKGYPYAKKAHELKPRNWFSLQNLILYETYYENFEEALRLAKLFEEIDPDSFNYELLEYYRFTGNYAAAFDMIKTLDEEEQLFQKIWLEGSKGNLEFFEANLENFRAYLEDDGEFNYMTACVYALNDLNDQAFVHLEAAFDSYVDSPEFLFIDPDLKTLHDDPRWDTILERLGAYFNYDFKHEG